jgi:hypothetical protein
MQGEDHQIGVTSSVRCLSAPFGNYSALQQAAMSMFKRFSHGKREKRKSEARKSQSAVEVALPAAQKSSLDSQPASPRSNGFPHESLGVDKPLPPVQTVPAPESSRAVSTPVAAVEPVRAPLAPTQVASHSERRSQPTAAPPPPPGASQAKGAEHVIAPETGRKITERGSLSSHKYPLHAILSHAISADKDPIIAPTADITSCLDLSLKESSFLEEVAAKHPTATELVGLYSDAKTPSSFKLVEQRLDQPFPASWKGHFDLVNATLTLSQIPASQWEPLFERIFSILKPGGWLQGASSRCVSVSLTCDSHRPCWGTFLSGASQGQRSRSGIDPRRHGVSSSSGLECPW